MTKRKTESPSVFKICSIALNLAGEKNTYELIERSLTSGKAYETFEKMVMSHSGNLKDSYNQNNYKYDIHISIFAGFTENY